MLQFILLVSICTTSWVYSQDVPVDITHSLLTLLTEEKQLRVQLEKDLTTLGGEITTLKNIEANVSCGCPWHQKPVAFTATLTKDITNLGVQQQIPFDNVILNVGGGYDARHGEFRAPVSGVYEFSVSMLMKGGQWSGIEIVKDGESIGKIRSGDSVEYSMSATVVTAQLQAGQDVWVQHIAESDGNVIHIVNFHHKPHGESIGKIRSGDSAEYSMSATVVTAQLQAGQDVWVQHISESDSNVIYGQTFSTFSGHLIQP